MLRTALDGVRRYLRAANELSLELAAAAIPGSPATVRIRATGKGLVANLSTTAPTIRRAMDSGPYENHLFNVRATVFTRCFATMTKIRWELDELRETAQAALGTPVTDDEVRLACADLVAGQLALAGDGDHWFMWAPVPPPGA